MNDDLRVSTTSSAPTVGQGGPPSGAGRAGLWPPETGRGAHSLAQSRTRSDRLSRNVPYPIALDEPLVRRSCCIPGTGRLIRALINFRRKGPGRQSPRELGSLHADQLRRLRSGMVHIPTHPASPLWSSATKWTQKRPFNSFDASQGAGSDQLTESKTEPSACIASTRMVLPVTVTSKSP